MKSVQGIVWAIAAVLLTFVLSRRIDVFDDTCVVGIFALANVIPFASGALLGVVAIATAHILSPGARSFRLVSSIWLIAITTCFALGAAYAALVLQRQGNAGSWNEAIEFLVRILDICTKVGLGLFLAAWIRPNAAAKT